MNTRQSAVVDVRSSQAESVAASPVLATHPLQAALCERMVEQAGILAQAFVEQTSGAVQSLLADAHNVAETRAILDLGHALSMCRASLMRGLVDAFRRRFDPLRRHVSSGIFDLERLCMLPTEELEESTALTQLVAEAERLGGEAGRQVTARLQWVARDLGLPALSDALAPQCLPECFAEAFRRAGLDVQERVLAYRLVESHALRYWPQLMEHALLVLDQQGLRMVRSLTREMAQDTAPMISAATTQMLRETQASLASGSDGKLAAALLRAIEPPHAPSAVALITSLAGSWVDGLLAEPELPPAFVPDLESLRLVVIKSAIADPTFFSHRLHPVRKAVDDLVRTAAFLGIQGYSLASVRTELKQMREHISVHGQFALDAMAMQSAPEPELAYKFLQQMASDQQARREGLLNRVRALANREIDARTLDMALPSAARMALTRGFLPLLSTLLLRFGAASARTRQARALLERFVDSFALCTTSQERQGVLAELVNLLQELGLPQAHIVGVTSELERAYAALEAEADANRGVVAERQWEQELDALLSIDRPSALPDRVPEPLADATSEPSPTAVLLIGLASNEDSRRSEAVPNPLSTLLQPGLWFRVRDHRRGDDRWLSLTRIHLDQDRVNFMGFDGATALSMRASQFIEDLGASRSEPLNPEPEIVRALAILREMGAVAATSAWHRRAA